MSALKTIQKGKRLTPPNIIVYGGEGVGKSTLGAGAPNPIFINTEDGLTHLDVASFPLATTYRQVAEQLDTLCREQHDYQTVVIDSLDWLERLIWDELCRTTNAKTIDDYGGGYGKGYTAALGIWREVIAYLNRLRSSGMAIVSIAHAKVEKFEDPEAPSFDRYAPRLNAKACGLLVEWADAVLFAKVKFRTKTEDSGFGAKRTTAASLNERVLRCTCGPACVAKNRYGLPEEIPLDWSSLMAAMYQGGSQN